MLLHKMTDNDIIPLKELYYEAFPKEERAPFRSIIKRTKRGKGDILISEENGKFIGMAMMVCNEDVAYLFYFAINAPFRGLGYGSKILKEINRMYSDKRVFLARETLDESADNYDQRVRRHNFYLRNGLVDWTIKIQEATVVYDVMGFEGRTPIKPEEYDRLMRSWGGLLLVKLIKMRAFEPC